MLANSNAGGVSGKVSCRYTSQQLAKMLAASAQIATSFDNFFCADHI